MSSIELLETFLLFLWKTSTETIPSNLPGENKSLQDVLIGNVFVETGYEVFVGFVNAHIPARKSKVQHSFELQRKHSPESSNFKQRLLELYFGTCLFSLWKSLEMLTLLPKMSNWYGWIQNNHCNESWKVAFDTSHMRGAT